MGWREPLLADAEESSLFGGRVQGGTLRSPSYADLGQVRIAEGGRPAGDEGERRKQTKKGKGSRSGQRGATWWRKDGASPLARRWLQVECEAGTGYQAHLALAEFPAVQAMESADLLAQLESLDFPVDFTVDMQVVPSERAREQVRRKKKELLDQAEQYGAQPTGMPHSLPEAAGALAEQDARLSRSSVEVEVQSVTVLTVWGPDPVVCDARARSLVALLSGGDYRAVRPHGMQKALWFLLATLVITVTALGICLPRRNNRGQIITLTIITALLTTTLCIIRDVDRPFGGIIDVHPTAIEEAERQATRDFLARHTPAELPCDNQGNRRDI